MNWKNHAHLFANGEFKVMNHDDGNHITLLDAYQLLNVNGFPDSFTLIARPISDMTDEEAEQIIAIDNAHVLTAEQAYEKRLRILREKIRKGTLEMWRLLDLLSIGVYPFDDKDDVTFKSKQNNLDQ